MIIIAVAAPGWSQEIGISLYNLVDVFIHLILIKFYFFVVGPIATALTILHCFSLILLPFDQSFFCKGRTQWHDGRWWGRRNEWDLPSTGLARGSHPKSKSLCLHLGLPVWWQGPKTWVNICYLPTHINRKLDGSGVSVTAVSSDKGKQA